MTAILFVPIISSSHHKRRDRQSFRMTLLLAIGTMVSPAAGSLVLAQEKPKSGTSYTIENIRGEYLKGVAPLIAAYRQSRIVAEVSEKTQSKDNPRNQSYELELLRTDGREKIVLSGLDESKRGAKSICVAAPDLCFLAEKPSDGQAFLRDVTKHSDRRCEELRDHIKNQSSVLRAPLNFFETPLAELLSPSSTIITAVFPEQIRGHNVIRIQLQMPPLSMQLKEAGIDVIKGWVLLEPDRKWTSHGVQFEYFDKTAKVFLTYTMNVEYGDLIDGNPAPTAVHNAAFGPGGHFRTDKWAKVKSVKFGPVEDKEFTLEGSGIEGIAPASERFSFRRSPWFYGALGAAFLFTVAILVQKTWKRREHRTSS